MNVTEYCAGIALLAIVASSLWLGGLALRRRLVPQWTGALGTLATLVLALSVAIVLLEALGLLGLLNVAALTICAPLLAAGLYLWLPRGGGGGRVPPAPTAGRIGIALAVVAAVLTAIHWAGPMLFSLEVGIYRQDSVWYHLPFAAWFAQTGQIGGLLFTDPLKLTVWYYPLNSELLHAAGMVLFDRDLLSPMLNFGWMALALLAAWCIGRPFGLAPATLLGAILIVGSEMMLIQAGNAPGDIVALACLLAMIAVLFNGWEAGGGSGPGAAEGDGPEAAGGSSRERRRLPIARGPLAVAALAGGLAVGAKVTMLAPVGVVTVALLAMGRGGARRNAAVWLGGLGLTGGFWYVRNLVHAGNPLPWIDIGPLPGPAQAPLYPRPAHSIAEYIADSHVWKEFFFPGLGDTLGPLWFLIVFAALAGLILGVRRRQDPLVRVLALAGAATLIAHVFIPVSASGPEGGPSGFASNFRYAAPGLAIGLVLLPLCESRWMARRVIAPGYALIAIFTAAFATDWSSAKPLAAIAIGALAVLLPLWWASRRSAPQPTRWLALGAVALLALVLGYPQQREYFDGRYLPDVAPPLDNPGFRSTNQWRAIQGWARSQHGLRIGIVGPPAIFGQYVLYGEDLSNEVRYLGEPQPHGGMTAIQSCKRWRERINEGHFDAVLVTPDEQTVSPLPQQVEWTAKDPASITALPVLPATLFVIRGPMNPELCSQVGRGYPTPLPGQFGNPNLPPGAFLPRREG